MGASTLKVRTIKLTFSNFFFFGFSQNFTPIWIDSRVKLINYSQCNEIWKQEEGVILSELNFIYVYIVWSSPIPYEEKQIGKKKLKPAHT